MSDTIWLSVREETQRPIERYAAEQSSAAT